MADQFESITAGQFGPQPWYDLELSEIYPAVEPVSAVANIIAKAESEWEQSHNDVLAVREKMDNTSYGDMLYENDLREANEAEEVAFGPREVVQSTYIAIRVDANKNSLLALKGKTDQQTPFAEIVHNATEATITGIDRGKKSDEQKSALKLFARELGIFFELESDLHAELMHRSSLELAAYL